MITIGVQISIFSILVCPGRFRLDELIYFCICLAFSCVYEVHYVSTKIPT